MSISGYWLRRQIAICLVMCMAVPFAEAATVRLQQAPPGQQAEGAHSVQAQSQNSQSAVNKPAASTTQPEGVPNNPDAAQAQTINGSQQSGTSQSAREQQQQQQNSPSKPVGTAAAPYEKTIGVPASRPAGAVIAPAKQRRTRSILIKVAVILGAAVAVGTVVGLSKASSNRPN